MGRDRVHVVLDVDGLDVLFESKLGMVDDVEELLRRADAAGQGWVVDDPDPTADELVELGEAGVGPHRYDDGDRREVVALAEHPELDDALEVARLRLEAIAHRPDVRLGHRVVQMGARDTVLFGDGGDLLGVSLAEG